MHLNFYVLNFNLITEMTIDKNLKSLRILVRQNSKIIMDHFIQNNISRLTKNNGKVVDICMFCGSPDNLTKEHVMPRWAFENSTVKFFNTEVNGIDQTYMKTTIPLCAKCNNNILSSIEKYINKSFSEADPDIRDFTPDEISIIIIWLEIIDFKFEILNARRLFKASKENGFIPYLADFPISVLRPNVNYSPIKAISEIRRSQKRLTVKDKSNNFNSLVIFKTANKTFHFFHTMDEFIFIELPLFKIALFYFYKKTFSTIEDGHVDAMKIIDKVYN